MGKPKKLQVIKLDMVISSACFPLKENEVLDLDSAYICLKQEFTYKEVRKNDAFNQIILKIDGCTINITYKGKLKFFSLLPSCELERLCYDLWADIFKKNLVKSTS